MRTASLTKNIKYDQRGPTIQVILNTNSSKEFRIAFKKSQVMRRHSTPFPIVVEIFEGSIDFRVDSEVFKLHKGDLLSLKGNVSHDLTAIKESIVRLSLNKSFDTVKQAEDLVRNSK